MSPLLLMALLADAPCGGGGNYGLVEMGYQASEVTLAEGFEATGDYDTVCTASTRRFDFDGVQACGPRTDVAPSALNFLAAPASPLATGGNQTGSNVVIRPGSGTHTAVVAAASFVNNTTTFTVTVDGTANTGTEGTAFECDSVTNTVCANNIANWIEGLAGAAGVHACSSGSTTTCTTFGFTAVAGTVYFFPAPEDSPGKFIDSIACSTGAAAVLTNGTAGYVLFPSTVQNVCFGSTNTCINGGSSGNNNIYFRTAAASNAVNVLASTFTGSIVASAFLRTNVDARTIADDATGANATLTLTPTTSYVEINCQDAQGCDVTMGEAGMTAGNNLRICIVAQTAGATNFADTAGVSELAGAFAANVDDCISMIYGNTTVWRETGRSAN